MSAVGHHGGIRRGETAGGGGGLQCFDGGAETGRAAPVFLEALGRMVEEVEEGTFAGHALVAGLGHEFREAFGEGLHVATMPAGGLADHAEVDVGAVRAGEVEIEASRHRVGLVVGEEGPVIEVRGFRGGNLGCHHFGRIAMQIDGPVVADFCEEGQA